VLRSENENVNAKMERATRNISNFLALLMRTEALAPTLSIVDENSFGQSSFKKARSTKKCNGLKMVGATEFVPRRLRRHQSSKMRIPFGNPATKKPAALKSTTG
jgi:hypothetical protein